MHQPRFYALLRAFFKLHISHTSYPIFPFCLQYNTTIFISTRHSVRHYGGCFVCDEKITPKSFSQFAASMLKTTFTYEASESTYIASCLIFNNSS